jgi:hypothetical protein
VTSLFAAFQWKVAETTIFNSPKEVASFFWLLAAFEEWTSDSRIILNGIYKEKKSNHPDMNFLCHINCTIESS